MRSPRKDRPHGSIVAVGGGEEKFEKPDILQRFVAEAGGAEARIAILPTASAIPAELAHGAAEALGR
jgi:cyanophycinase